MREEVAEARAVREPGLDTTPGEDSESGGEVVDSSSSSATGAQTEGESESSSSNGDSNGSVMDSGTETGEEPPPGLPNGEQCELHAECSSGQCWIFSTGPTPIGVCSDCNSDGDCMHVRDLFAGRHRGKWGADCPERTGCQRATVMSENGMVTPSVCVAEANGS